MHVRYDPNMPSAAAELLDAIADVPGGAWAVGVSGGADSVALLSLLRTRTDLALHAVHLDHQTRGQDSTDDAAFVAALAARWKLPCVIGRLDEVEPRLVVPPANISARYRAARLQLFREAVEQYRLNGVVLAHHRDDQIETIFQRLLRGSSYVGLCGMCSHAVVSGLRVARPLLGVSRAALREHLRSIGEAWREDASNQSDKYGRNRVRRALAEHPEVGEAMLELGRACTRLRDDVQAAAPVLAPQWPVQQAACLPPLVAEMSVRQWLVARGMPHEQVDPGTISRVIAMATDAATAPKVQLTGSMVVRRRGGMIFADDASSAGR
jgi:tRNA(Ile)-lysidine synthetase-like protein